MELKEYQSRALDAFTRWLDALDKAECEAESAIAALEGMSADILGEVRNYPKKAWKRLVDSGDIESATGGHVERVGTNGEPIPHICFKIPTGGGKTLLAASALERLNMPTGLVLWMVPSTQIYRQTKSALWNREHPYREMLERASGGRVKMLEKDDFFTAADLEYYLCVMLISLQSANHNNDKDFLKMRRNSGQYSRFFPDGDELLADAKLLNRYCDLERTSSDGPVKHSLLNVFKMKRPVMVLDEAHKAYKKNVKQFEDSINRLNPSVVIELSATPDAKRSNLLVDISGSDLKAEEMIKLPVHVTSYMNTDWQYTLSQAQDKLEELGREAESLQEIDGRYIRPIAVVRVERTGKDQRDGERVHSDDVRDYLVDNLGIPENAVAIKSSSQDDLEHIDLLSEYSTVRWVITQSALMEGWDCPFAYVLVMLDNTRAQTAITQLVGRVMRQPHARRTHREKLDQCYVYCTNTDVGLAVKKVKQGLEQQGLTGLNAGDVWGNGGGLFKPTKIKRRDTFRCEEIFLPKVLHVDGADGLVELDYVRHILPCIDWSCISAPNTQAGQASSPRESQASVDVDDDRSPTESYYNHRELYIDTSVKISWYSRRLSDIVPNPWQATRVCLELIERLRSERLTDEGIYSQRSVLASQLREHVSNEVEKQAENVFRRKLEREEIRFDLEASDPNYRVVKHYEMMVAQTDTKLQQYGQEVQISLFAPVFNREYNDLERRFAFYLDEQKALKWWHRVSARQHGDYYIRGWRRERIWPDFVAMAGENQCKPSILVFEPKGDHLKGNADTEYKKRVFRLLEEHLNAGEMTIQDGPAKGVFRLVFDREGFPDAEEALEKVQSIYKA